MAQSGGPRSAHCRQYSKLFGECGCRLAERHYFATVLPSELDGVIPVGKSDEAWRTTVITQIGRPLVGIGRFLLPFAHVDVASLHNERVIGRKRLPSQKRCQLRDADRLAY